MPTFLTGHRRESRTDELHLLGAAHHEAGHAVMGWRYGEWVRERGIVVHSDHLGEAHVRCKVWPGTGDATRAMGDPDDRSLAMDALRWCVEADVRICLGGPIAEKIFLHRNGIHLLPLELPEPDEYSTWVENASESNDEWNEPWNDTQVACRALCELADPPRLRLEARRVSRLLRYPKTWSAVEALALPLAKTGFLSDDEAYEILQSAASPTSSFPRSLRERRCHPKKVAVRYIFCSGFAP